MTALPQYDLLEAEGRYFDGEATTPREVIVKFGDASLMILDTHDMPVTHWPLATLRNVARGEGAMTLSPDRAGGERLVVDDATMIEALRSVCPELEIRKPIPRNRWRKFGIWAAAVIFAIYLIGFHLLPSLSNQIAELIPPDAEVAMGETMSVQFAQQVTGFQDPNFCATPEGTRALARLTARLEPAGGAHVSLDVKVLDHKAPNALALPGGHIILTSGLLALADTPEAVAGVLAHEIAHVVRRDPTRLTLQATGLGGILAVLRGDFTGAGATAAFSGALKERGYKPEVETAADAFAADLLARQGLPSTAFAEMFLRLAKKTETTTAHISHLALHGATHARATRAANLDTIGNAPFEPALSDQQWVALRGICR